MPRRTANAAAAEPPLVEWEEPGPQLDVLDWRRRATAWGLADVAGDRDVAEEPVFAPTPDRLLDAEEPESHAPQELPDNDEEGFDSSALVRERPEDGIQSDEADPIRLYLRQIGRTPLLTADQERQIGYSIELARADLQSAIGRIPCAVQCLMRLADRVRTGAAPAAE